MPEQYRVGIIGCGKRGRRHAEAYLADRRCEIVALADVARENAEALAEELAPGASVYSDHRQMLSAESLDISSICLWTGLHLPVFRNCAEAGVRAVLCEKPMAPTWGGSLEMGELARRHDVQLTFCHQRRFNPGIQQARQMLRDGIFGELKRMDLFSPRNLLDCGTHTIDLALMFNDEVHARWVMGQIDARQAPESFGIPREYVAVGFIRFDNGVRATLEVGEDRELPTGVRLIGSNGVLEVSWGGGYGQAVVFDDPDWTPREPEEANPLPLVVENNIDCLESGEEPELAVEKALRATEIVFAIFESSRSRARIELPLHSRDSALLTMLEQGEIGPGR